MEKQREKVIVFNFAVTDVSESELEAFMSFRLISLWESTKSNDGNVSRCTFFVVISAHFTVLFDLVLDCFLCGEENRLVILKRFR
jgi:hypothetical protein